MEAELNTITETIKEAAHLNRIMSELFLNIDAKLQVYCDNQSTIIITKSKPSEHMQCTKHYALKLAFLCESVDKLNINFKYLPTEVMPANILTKALGRAHVIKLCSFINLVELKVESKGRVV